MSAQELPAITTEVVSRPQRPAETRLRLRGLTADGEQLLLVDPAGLEFTVPVDARLRAALHGDPSRSEKQAAPPAATTPTPPPTRAGTVEKTMESILRPRDIQARIRAGETPEAVAEAAQTTVDKVMPYAAPVLAEREHVAQRALRASIRRPAGEASAGTSRTLGEAISARLRGMNVDPDTVAWDAWRREDGRWSLTAAFTAGGTDGLARLTFDQPGNFVLLDNDEARWLVGDQLESAPLEESEPEHQLAAVPIEHRPSSDELGVDAIELVSEPELDDITAEQPIEAYLDVQATESTTEIEPVAAEPLHDPAADEPAARPAKKKRSSVPSWDEILFGGPSDGDSA